MEVYNATTDEQFPRLPWYDLNYQNIIDMVNEMLDEFIFGLDKFASTDPRIKALLDEAEKAKSFPDLEKCRMAVLGEQGAGKSTILTALMGGRNLLDRSGDTKSCTAVPTIIEHKKGADDNIRESDVTIQWLSADEILAHVLEQIRRWTNVYPGTDPVVHEAEENEEDEVEGSSDEEDFPGIGNEDCEAEELPELTPKMRKDLERDDGASTAKEFSRSFSKRSTMKTPNNNSRSGSIQQTFGLVVSQIYVLKQLKHVSQSSTYNSAFEVTSRDS
jgi:hypothetical protein